MSGTAGAAALPMIIQGGMGIGVSNWQLAKAVSTCGHMGVVSGTCIDSLFVRRLQDGDFGGHLRRIIENFPLPHVSAEALEHYFIPDGKAADVPYKLLSMWRQQVSAAREAITMLSSYAEVALAKEGHDGLVGINLLTKVQMPNLATLYGAMLAGVDYVLMGAGIPKDIPGALDAMAEGRPASLKFDVEGAQRGENHELVFDPARHFPDGAPELPRPKFLPIVSSHSLATMLSKKSSGRIDGFIVEGPTAGGHNAPPRGPLQLDDAGEPIYGERDECDVDAMRELGLPFWLAGGTGSPEQLRNALDAGAAGIQVGTLFAYSKESGLEDHLKRNVLDLARVDNVNVRTDVRASPTGFPFKLVQLRGTNSQKELYHQRERVCDLGYLRTAYRMENGRVNYRCAAEPVDTYIKKGGTLEDTVDRKCLCNALFANLGHGQVREGGDERALLTSGDDFTQVRALARTRGTYSAADAIGHLMAGVLAEVG